MSAPAKVQRKARTFPIIEVFGPTVQGEGPEAGRPCYFIRTGGCDYRCSWCDTPYAVDPAEVRKNSEKLDTNQIMERISGLSGHPGMVVISGGNPALLLLSPLVAQLHLAGYDVSVETQGSIWRNWLGDVERLVVSPKPPSSEMATPKHEAFTENFMQQAIRSGRRLALKVVCFDDADYEWALSRKRRWPSVPLYLSAGTPQIEGDPLEVDVATKVEVLKRFRWLCDKVAEDPRAKNAVALPQLHVLAYGTMRGV